MSASKSHDEPTPVPATSGLESARVAEIVATRADGSFVRGSGYLMTAASVLTALHVVSDATALEVRFNAGLPTAWTGQAEVGFVDALHDLAVLTLVDPPAIDVAPVRLGRLGDRAAVLDVHVAGFPRWKVRMKHTAVSKRHRVLAHEPGSVAVLANRREHTLQIVVAPPARDPDPDANAWEGMSGGPVFAVGRLVAVVIRQYAREGPNRITAARIDQCLETLASSDRNRLLGLLAAGSELVDVVPRPQAELVRTAYHQRASEIVPVDGLQDRAAELDRIALFCAGDEPYLWWQGPPWAGKTALLATFAAKPPDGVDVVSHFVTAAVASSANSDSFTLSLLEQLAALNDESVPSVLDPIARDAHRRRLLHEVATRCQRDGRRLVLVIDGLDEDLSRSAGFGQPSIASLLPATTDGALRVIVAGRRSPVLPDDVATGHPLRRCVPTLLHPSEFAADLERRARGELTLLLNGPVEHRDLLGLIVASGGELTCLDLEELTGIAHDRIEDLLEGVAGRTFRSLDDHAACERRGYAMAHETLLTEARSRLQVRQLNLFRARISRWASTYRTAGWPVDTPRYLLRDYARLLEDAGEAEELAQLAGDARRHSRMLDVTGGDSLAFAEIHSAQRLLLRDNPDLCALALLAVPRDNLATRNSNIPTQLPAVWAVLGQPDRAESLARGLTDPFRQASALTGLVEVAWRAGDQARATAIADDIERLVAAEPRVDIRAHLLAELAMALMVTDDRDGAMRLLDAMEASLDDPATPYLLDGVRRSLLGPLGAADRYADATRVAEAIVDPYCRARAAIESASTAANAGQPGWSARFVAVAERSLPGIENPQWRASTAAELKQLGVGSGPDGLTIDGADSDDTRTLLASAMTAYRRNDHTLVLHRAERITHLLVDMADMAERDPGAGHSLVLLLSATEFCSAIELLAKTGQLCDAERLVRLMPTATVQSEAMARLAWEFYSQGHPEHATGLAVEAEALARASSDLHWERMAIVDLARALVATGDLDRAERITRVTDAEGQGHALFTVVEALAQAQGAASAERVARSISVPAWRAQALAKVAAAFTTHQDDDHLAVLATDAIQALAVGDDGLIAAIATHSLGTALATMGDRQRAIDLTNAIASPTERYDTLAQLAQAVNEDGDLDDAIGIALLIDDEGAQGKALSELVKALCRSGDLTTAMALAETIGSSYFRLDAIFEALLAAGQLDIAERAVDFADSLVRSSMLHRISKALPPDSPQSEWERLINRIEEPFWRTQSHIEHAAALASIGKADSAAQVIAAMTDEQMQDRARGQVASRLIEHGSRRPAWPMLLEISHPDELLRVVTALLDAGHSQVAADLVRAVSTPTTQATGFVALAQSDAFDTSTARHFLGRALLLGPWVKAVCALGRVDPAALHAVADHLMRDAEEPQHPV